MVSYASNTRYQLKILLWFFSCALYIIYSVHGKGSNYQVSIRIHSKYFIHAVPFKSNRRRKVVKKAVGVIFSLCRNNAGFQNTCITPLAIRFKSKSNSISLILNRNRRSSAFWDFSSCAKLWNLPMAFSDPNQLEVCEICENEYPGSLLYCNTCAKVICKRCTREHAYATWE